LKRIIITGAPGTGKSTLLESLQKRDMIVFKEASRKLIKEESKKSNPALPWINLPKFAELCLQEMVLQYQQAIPNQLNFYDRAIPDIIAYLKNGDEKISNQYYSILDELEYHPIVFYTPTWRKIYTQDNERPQTYQESLCIADYIYETYEELGFQLIKLPLKNPEQRADFVMQIIESFKIKR